MILAGGNQEGQREDGHGASLPEPGDHRWRGSASVYMMRAYSGISTCGVECWVNFLMNWCGDQVSIAPVPGKRLEHTGIKIELLGQIGKNFDRPQQFLPCPSD